MVLGINRRNALIARRNPPESVRLVRDKLRTKTQLRSQAVPVPPTLATIGDADEARDLDWDALGEGWVMKPCASSQGRGVLVVIGRRGGSWALAGGQVVGLRRLIAHADAIVDGDHSGGRPDRAIIEPLLVAHPDILPLAPVGLPDIRVICLDERPLLAMMRLPTRTSGGRGNLHQGGIGAAVDLRTGRVTRAVHGGHEITEHPDTHAAIVGSVVPEWPAVLDAARRAGVACGLGYSGSDVVVDGALGAVVLEVNAHPGLEIQNVCGVSLLDRISGLPRGRRTL